MEWCKINLPDAVDSPTDDVEDELPRKKFKNTQPHVSHYYFVCVYVSVLIKVKLLVTKQLHKDGVILRPQNS